MTRLLFAAAFALGAAAILWMGRGFVGTNGLALLVTAVIGAVYLLGIAELLRYRRATASLSAALETTPARSDEPHSRLESWLQQLDPSLQNAARLRVEGDRGGLPAPVFTPYLVGLLVMLGLLGTFIGMVGTLGGAVLALQGSTELEAIRAGLAAPIEGLAVAFGTSVAGVAASAALGLISTLCRRERMLATRQLDHLIAAEFREFSAGYQRQQTLEVMRQQADALPAVTQRLQELAGEVERMGQGIGEQLLAGQNRFHESARSDYSELAASVDRSLGESLAQAGREAGSAIEPAVAAAMATLQQQAASTQRQLADTATQQLSAFRAETAAANDAMLAAFDRATEAWSEQTRSLQADLAASMGATAAELSAGAATTSQQLLGEVGTLLQATEALVQARQASEQAWLDTQREQMAQLTGALRCELTALRAAEESGQQASAQRLAQLEGTVATHLAQLGRGLEEPMARLIETAAETPRAAADVIAQLRSQISANLERDNRTLAERNQLMEQLNSLAEALQQVTGRQRDAIDELVSGSATTLQAMSAQFNEQAGSGVAKLAEVAAHFTGSSAELASLAEAFNAGVDAFSQANDRLIDNLARIEESMQAATARSDEQMGYYVAQAREIIDQSMLSQQGIIEDLRQLGETRLPATAGAS